MATPYDELRRMKWNEHERRCAVVQILCKKGDELSNKEVAEMVGVSRQRVSELRKSLLESMDPRGVVDRAIRNIAYNIYDAFSVYNLASQMMPQSTLTCFRLVLQHFS